MNAWPNLKIGNLEANLLLGAMGVRVMGRKGISTFINLGGAGILPAVGLGAVLNPEELEKNPREYARINADALREEIRATREMTSQDATGVLGVNIMYPLTDCRTLAEAAVEEGVKLIIASAGAHEDLPGHVQDRSVAIVPKVSYAKFAESICRLWEKHDYLPPAIIVEGAEAGGHLGFGLKKLQDPNFAKDSLEKNVQKTLALTQKFGNIPVIAAGGIYDGGDIRKALSWGASGVLMATRFVTTEECDVADEFKRAYLNAGQDDIKIIKSPVGMYGRAISNPFLEGITRGEQTDFKCGYNCLSSCNPKESLFCIADALVGAQGGDFRRGFAFTGTNAYRSTAETCLNRDGSFITMGTLMERLNDEYLASE